MDKKYISATRHTSSQGPPNHVGMQVCILPRKEHIRTDIASNTTSPNPNPTSPTDLAFKKQRNQRTPLTPIPCSTIGAIVPNMTAPTTVAPMASETARVATVVAPGVSSTRMKEATDSTHADATPALASRQTTRQRFPWWISPVASPRMTIAEL